MEMKLTQDGFEKIEKNIDLILGHVTDGITDPLKTRDALSEIRCGLFNLKNLLRTVIILEPGAREKLLDGIAALEEGGGYVQPV
jgi:hypothetical protein